MPSFLVIVDHFAIFLLINTQQMTNLTDVAPAVCVLLSVNQLPHPLVSLPPSLRAPRRQSSSSGPSEEAHLLQCLLHPSG